MKKTLTVVEVFCYSVAHHSLSRLDTDVSFDTDMNDGCFDHVLQNIRSKNTQYTHKLTPASLSSAVFNDG